MKADVCFVRVAVFFSPSLPSPRPRYAPSQPRGPSKVPFPAWSRWRDQFDHARTVGTLRYGGGALRRQPRCYRRTYRRGVQTPEDVGIFSVERHQHDGFDLTPGTFDTTGAPYRRYDALAKLQRQVTPSFSLGGRVTG